MISEFHRISYVTNLKNSLLTGSTLVEMSGYEMSANDGDVEVGGVTSVEIPSISTTTDQNNAEKNIIKISSTESIPSSLGERKSLVLKESTHEIGHDIAWCDLSYDVGPKHILDNCYGKVMAGQVCAIMGPSGNLASFMMLPHKIKHSNVHYYYIPCRCR